MPSLRFYDVLKINSRDGDGYFWYLQKWMDDVWANRHFYPNISIYSCMMAASLSLSFSLFRLQHGATYGISNFFRTIDFPARREKHRNSQIFQDLVNNLDCVSRDLEKNCLVPSWDWWCEGRREGGRGTRRLSSGSHNFFGRGPIENGRGSVRLVILPHNEYLGSFLSTL